MIPFQHNDLQAQAQECVVEKSILDNRPANVTAKLSQYIMEVYENIGAQLLGFDSNDKLVLPKYSKVCVLFKLLPCLLFLK